MTIPTNKEIKHALQACLNHLSDTRYDNERMHEYICWALDETPHIYGVMLTTVAHIRKKIIYPRLEGCCTVRAWLVAQGINEDLLLSDSGRAVQLHRRAWVNQLIKEFSR